MSSTPKQRAAVPKRPATSGTAPSLFGGELQITKAHVQRLMDLHLSLHSIGSSARARRPSSAGANTSALAVEAEASERALDAHVAATLRRLDAAAAAAGGVEQSPLAVLEAQAELLAFLDAELVAALRQLPLPAQTLPAVVALQRGHAQVFASAAQLAASVHELQALQLQRLAAEKAAAEAECCQLLVAAEALEAKAAEARADAASARAEAAEAQGALRLALGLRGGAGGGGGGPRAGAGGGASCGCEPAASAGRGGRGALPQQQQPQPQPQPHKGGPGLQLGQQLGLGLGLGLGQLGLGPGPGQGPGGCGSLGASSGAGGCSGGSRSLSLGEARELSHALLASKALSDARADREGLPRETLAQHVGTHFSQRYGLRSLVLEWVQALNAAVAAFGPGDAEVGAVGAMLGQAVDEGYWQLHLAAKQAVADLLKVYLQAKWPRAPAGQLSSMLALRLSDRQPLCEDEWSDVLRFMHSHAEALQLQAALRETARQLQRQRQAQAGAERSHDRGAAGAAGGAAAAAAGAAGDGSLPFSALRQAVCAFQLRQHVKLLRPFAALFRAHDADADGCVSGAELLLLGARLRGGPGPLPPAEAQALLRAADPRGVGRLTFSQAVGALAGEIVSLATGAEAGQSGSGSPTQTPAELSQRGCGCRPGPGPSSPPLTPRSAALGAAGGAAAGSGQQAQRQQTQQWLQQWQQTQQQHLRGAPAAFAEAGG